MNGHLSCFFAALPFLIIFTSISAFSLPPDEYIEEAPDFEGLLSDLPPGFDLSSATIDELRRIPFLSPQDIQSIAALRDSLPGQYDRKDSYRVTGRLSPLVRYLLENSFETHGKKVDAGRMQIRGGIAVGRGETPEEGRHYLKVTAGSSDRTQLSVISERDPREPRAMDLASFGISFPVKRLNSLVTLGDFRPGFGMGLLFSRYTAYLANDRPRYYHTSTSLNTSFEETRFMRGGMIITRSGAFESCIWTSMRRLDAAVEGGKAVSIDDTGIHPSGKGSGNLVERITGVHLSLSDHASEISATGAISRYSPGFSRPEGEKYFGRPEGASFPQFSISGRTGRGPAEISFEHALMRSGAHATLGGIVIECGRAEAGLLFRDYSQGYWAPRSGAPSAFGDTSNERGIRSSMELTLPARIQVNASLDLAKMRGRSWTHPMPISRGQVFFSLRKTIRPRLEGNVALRSSEDTGSDGKRWSLRGGLEQRAGKTRGWGWRGTAAWSSGEGKGGPFAEAALSGKYKNGIISCSLGGFRIPSYFSRYYQYQPDVPGRGATEAVWGNGCSVSVVCTIGVLSGRLRMADSDLMPIQREITLQTDLSF